MTASASNIDIPGWVALISLLVGGATTVVVVIMYGRQRATRMSLADIIATNGELRRDRDDLRRELAEVRLKHVAEVAELRGQLNAMTGHLAEDIIKAVAEAVARAPKLIATNGDPK